MQANIVALKPTSEKPSKFTASWLNKLQPRARMYQVRDTETNGLTVRVYPSGVKALYIQRRVGRGRSAKQILRKLGTVGDITLPDARKRAAALIADTLHGIDPTEAKVGDMPLGHLLDLYEKRLKARQVVKRTDMMYSLRTYLQPYVKTAVADLSRQNIVRAMDGLEEKGKHGAADYLRKTVASMLNWAVDKGHVQASVMAGYRRERATRAERLAKPRIVLKTTNEIKAFWRASETASNSAFRDLMRFLLLTGQRRTETASLRWAHLSGDVWSIPADITKTGVEQKVPLGPMSKRLIEAQDRHVATDLVFVGRDANQISGWTQLLKPIREAMAMPTLAPHALRRSYRTGLAELGVPSDVAEVMIAHKRSDLIALYNHSDLWSARVAAQVKWEKHLYDLLADN